MRLILLAGALLFSHSAWTFDHSHKAWDAILKANVTTKGSISQVNYKAIKKKPAPLNKYVAAIEGLTQAEYDKFSKDQQLSFLINAYNALTVKIIVDNYPVESIKDIGSLFTSTWKKKFFSLFGKKRHLDHIEHKIIRKKFDEPRIHFAVVCAAKGCPKLLGEAYVATRLEKQLQKSAELFVKDPKRNRYDAKTKTLTLSKIFKWYGEDFEKSHGSVKKYVETILGKIKVEDTEYFDYDWGLNQSP